MSTKVEIVKDNHGDFHVHAAGCRDLDNKRRYEQTERSFGKWEIEVNEPTDIANEVYGPGSGSFYEEAGGDREFPGGVKQFLESCMAQFEIAPCVKIYPSNVAAIVPKPFPTMDNGLIKHDIILEIHASRKLGNKERAAFKFAMAQLLNRTFGTVESGFNIEELAPGCSGNGFYFAPIGEEEN